MGVTRLKRKEKRNRTVADARLFSIKLLMQTPTIKKCDVEELKKEAQA